MSHTLPKRGYLSSDEGDLNLYFRFLSAAINHLIEVVNVLVKCSHGGDRCSPNK